MARLKTRLYLVTPERSLGAFGCRLKGPNKTMLIGSPATGDRWTKSQWTLFYRVVNHRGCGLIELKTREVTVLAKLATKVF